MKNIELKNENQENNKMILNDERITLTNLLILVSLLYSIYHKSLIMQ